MASLQSFAVRAAVVVLATVTGAAPCWGQTMRTLSASRPVGQERFLHVTLDFSGGTLVVAPAAVGRLYGLRLRYDADRYAPVQQYDPRTGILRLGVEATGGMGMQVSSRTQRDQTAQFEFSPDVPLALYATVGASDATLDLGGTTLTELDIHSSAAHTTLDFSRPTRGDCKSASFSVGASQLDVRHLAQAGCAALSVDGGAGGASLAFNGVWRRNATLVVDLAMGGLTLILPRGTGVRLAGQRFLAPFNSNGFVKSGDIWITPGYEHAPHQLDVELKASMVGINVEWIAAP